MISLITPTRGDRPKFLDKCVQDHKNNNLAEHLLINYPPLSSAFDLTQRVRKGINLSAHDNVSIIEDDDYYPFEYTYFIDCKLDNYDVVGYPYTWYYNIVTRRYEMFRHPGRSSLFCTSFRKSVLKGFVWPKDDEPFLDIYLWRYLIREKKVYWATEKNPMPIGIKHGIGKCGGRGHVMNLKHSDPNMEWLRDHVGKDSFDFYQSLGPDG